MSEVLIYDATMSVGIDGDGLKLSLPERLAIVELLDDLGVAYIEAGRPGASARDRAFFEEVAELQLLNARFVALGPVRRAEATCNTDLGLQALLRANTPVLATSATAWRPLMTSAAATGEAYRDSIRDSVAYLRERVDHVIFKARHFFDGFVDDAEYAVSLLQAAVEAGADAVMLCDTNGGTLTHHFEAVVARVNEKFDVPIGVQAHNDSDLAVANSLAAVRKGASIVEGTINGFGKRCGGANLVSVIPGLELKMGARCLPEGNLVYLTRVARSLDELANHVPEANQPYAGRNAFAERLGGRSIHSVANLFHIAPRLVGNQQRVLIADQAGHTDVHAKLREYGLDLDPDDPQAVAVAERVRSLEAQGYQFEGAEASFRLLVNEALGRRHRYFALDELNVNTAVHGDHHRLPRLSGRAVARVRLILDAAPEEAQADGNGPVHAMDAAVRKLVHPYYPALRAVRLVDYKVRILSSGIGTESMCRVLIQSSDGEELWGTIGVSANIIQASWIALVDALEYKLFKDGVEPLRLGSAAVDT